MAVDCALPLDCSEGYGHLTIDGWSLHTGAWCAFDLSDLYLTPESRGGNVLVESQAGRTARPILDDETDYSLPMMFSGAVDRLGGSHPSAPAGLHANRQAFVAQMIDPIRAGTATLPASLVVPGVGTFAGGVQPLRLTWAALPNGYARAVLTLRIPRGRLLLGGAVEPPPEPAAEPFPMISASSEQTPESAAWGGELGWEFEVGATGLQAVGMRVLPAAGGDRSVTLWRVSDGAALATQTVPGTSGVWSEAMLSTPVPLTAGIRYRVSAAHLSEQYYRQADPLANGFAFHPDVTWHIGVYSDAVGVYPASTVAGSIYGIPDLLLQAS